MTALSLTLADRTPTQTGAVRWLQHRFSGLGPEERSMTLESMKDKRACAAGNLT